MTYNREQLEQLDIVALQDIADEFGLYSDLDNEDDCATKEEMINDILQADKEESEADEGED